MNTNDIKNLTAGDFLLVTDTEEEVTFVAYSRGWVEVIDGDNRTAKFRATALEIVGEEAPAFNAKRLIERRKEYVGQLHCGDELAAALDGVDLSVLFAWATTAGYPLRGSNNGQIRMNLGNRLRAALRRLDDHGRTVMLADLAALSREPVSE